MVAGGVSIQLNLPNTSLSTGHERVARRRLTGVTKSTLDTSLKRHAQMSVTPAKITAPLEDPSYLLSTVETIVDSINDRSLISAHDLLDAYNTFSSRIRFQSQALQDCDRQLPALDCLKLHNDVFLQALQRDIRLAHVDPFLALLRPTISSDEAIHTGPSLTNTRIDAKQCARNSSLLCNHALCALAAIFRFPALYSLFHSTC